ncbi:tRNA lysidine(34) synthetase TilS [Rhodovulum adriaticum]|uniref:tRNA(Ile)-lysidine synthase n=1 Tax=Rhodovulum adriaticum TaxID=35804 RepID=A0A4R2NML3_RHOAD|nr:tRNA lysidine(34) synthetase TilS [Rhodovulum adriaticum]MBK1636952.1 tRNA lysidine(34) synthetase TilS [Rhodovulum adriaticum]TCP22752.1 tRNA(Ile)-lysidine synthase [Rhodovulum adriaticum]
MAAALARNCPDGVPLGVAVSGGGDSLALLLALAEVGGRPLHAVTVDHGLRPEAAAEARFVAQVCARLGVSHDTLTWGGWQGRGNLQDAARQARYRLIADWARARGIGHVALGHTRDDQAETLLLRLARGSGVDGLSGMAPRRRMDGIAWLRPLLEIPRADLRVWLRDRGQDWIEDPSNDDPRFDRVRARAALAALAPLGVDPAGLAATAARLAEARAALEHYTVQAAGRIVRQDRGDLLLARAGLRDLPAEIARRLSLAALRWVASAPYGPRAEALTKALETLENAPRVTLHGCLITCEGDSLRITREPAAVAETVAPPGTPWDGRWQVSGPGQGGETVRALGESGLAACPDWRAAGSPRQSLLASPAVWAGDRLVAAPLAGWPQGWRATPLPGFADWLVSH